MKKKISKTLKLFILLAMLILLSACSILGGGDDREIKALEEQINQMATQNALLQKQIESSSNEEVQAPSPPEENTQPQVSLITPTLEVLPDQLVQAGVPIIYDGWSLLVSKNIEIRGLNSSYPIPLIRINITLKNLGMDNRIFRYSNSAISLRDNIGNDYVAFPGWDFNRFNCEQDYYTLKNLTVEAQDRVTLEGDPRDCAHLKNFQAFEGPVPLGANQLILMLTDFGPFTGVEIVIDL